MKTLVIAEVGVNHNGSVELAKELIDAAVYAGADIVKFQTFKADKIVSKDAPKAMYQQNEIGGETQYSMLKRLELTNQEHFLLKRYCEAKNIRFLSTAFDFASIDFLHNMGLALWKIPSGEITNLPYLEKIAKLEIPNKEIVISTGMATIDEIKNALNILEKNGVDKKYITVLHCNTEYPTPFEDVNLNAISYLKKEFQGYKIGFSDHSEGYLAGIASVPYGITFIEKHFTLDKNFEGPDHKASVTPEELKNLCEGIRIIERCLGVEDKIVTSSERKNKVVARKSIIANCKIRKGEIFTEKNLTTKRPGNGISPMCWYEILGKEAERDFEEDELIEDSRFNKQEV